MKDFIGFLQRSRRVLDDCKHDEHMLCNYRNIINVLSPIATKHRDSLSTSFFICLDPGLSIELLQDVLLKLYPESSYICTQMQNEILCYKVL